MTHHRDLRVVVAHNSYQQRGGEDAVVDAEIALLRSFGHEVIEYRRDNSRLPSIPRLSMLRDTLWSPAVASELSDVIRDVTPH